MGDKSPEEGVDHKRKKMNDDAQIAMVPTPRPRSHQRPRPKPCRSIEEYERVNFIDQGTFGLVFRAKCLRTGEEVAVKQVKFERDVGRTGFPITALREANILLALRHPNIVRVKEMVVGSTIDKFYMVMELGDIDLRTCLDKQRTPFSSAVTKSLLHQLISAVSFMRDNWVMHRDLKTSNLLYSNSTGLLKVCDFGMARRYGEPLQPYTQPVVTLWYRAPELLLGAKRYSPAVDDWSVGCIFAELLLLSPLLPGQGEADQIHRTFKLLGAPTEASWPGYGELPLASLLSYRLPSASALRTTFPNTAFMSGGGSVPALSDSGFRLLSGLLTANPNNRASCVNAMESTWFREKPLPAPAEEMPVFSL
jgi:cell division cycle 2-like protein